MDKNLFDKIVGLGNDFRNSINEDINIYGVNPSIAKKIEFSSATANHASIYTYQDILNFYKQNKKELNKKSFFFSLQRNIKREIKGYFSDTVKYIYLSPSGTDSEYLPLLGKEKKIFNIVLGIDEIGTSIKQTSKGKIFSSEAPHGDFKNKNIKLNEFKKKIIKTVFIPISLNNNNLVRQKDLATHLTLLISENYKKYDKIILHIVYVSKSHKIFPEIKFVSTIKKKFKNLKIVVDACQMRCDFKSLSSFLEKNYDIIITGSKFFNAPPFCSAYLTNEPIKKLNKNSDLNKIFNDTDLVMNPKVSYGLLFRWKFALNEIKNFKKIQVEDRIDIIKNLQNIIQDSLKNFKAFELEKSKQTSGSDSKCIEDNLTIFLFYLKRNNNYIPLHESKKIYKCVKNISSKVSLLSQPMKIIIKGNSVGNFRISISSSHIISIFKEYYDYDFFKDELLRLLNFVNSKI